MIIGIISLILTIIIFSVGIKLVNKHCGEDTEEEFFLTRDD